MRSAVRFRLPPELEATAPPEARGLRRDHVRLLLVDRATGSVRHHRFHELPRLLEPGDLLVANDSRTLPASLLGHTTSGAPLEVRLAAREDGRWAALVLGVPTGGGDPALVATDVRPRGPARPWRSAWPPGRTAAGRRWSSGCRRAGATRPWCRPTPGRRPRPWPRESGCGSPAGSARPRSVATRRPGRWCGWHSTWPGSGWPRRCTGRGGRGATRTGPRPGRWPRTQGWSGGAPG